MGLVEETKIKDDPMVKSKLPVILKNINYAFRDFATRDSKCTCELDKRKEEGGHAVFIFSLFLGKTGLSNTFAEI